MPISRRMEKDIVVYLHDRMLHYNENVTIIILMVITISNIVLNKISKAQKTTYNIILFIRAKKKHTKTKPNTQPKLKNNILFRNTHIHRHTHI